MKNSIKQTFCIAKLLGDLESSLYGFSIVYIPIPRLNYCVCSHFQFFLGSLQVVVFF